MNPEMNSEGESIIPRELLGQLPRRTRLEGGIQWVVVVTILLVITVAIILWASMNAVQLMRTRTALRHESSEAVGVVEEVSRSRVYYSFTVNERSFKGDASRQGSKLRDSDLLPIRYLPTNPAINHPAAWEEPTVLVWIPFWVPALLVLILLVVLIRMRICRRLLTEGMPAVAVVTKCSRGGRGIFYVDYEFRTEGGTVMTGNCNDCREEIGASFCVLYLPQNPRRNMRYPSSDYRVVQ